MIEVEIKIPADPDEAEKRLTDNGFSRDTRLIETDIYFDNAAGNIRKNDTALRIRTVEYPDSGLSEAYLTFKGNRCDNVSMTRPEYESSIDRPEEVRHILKSLGYEPVKPVVIKERTIYIKGSISACLDRVEGLGDFLELEIITDTNTKDAALAQLWDELEVLGYDRADTTTVSYLSMLQSFIADRT
ncbi:MAG: class IV adenylate cyclase [Lachnospiraceae bacterium]|nr:class IV adenylate cyclase [Lachnospiraceae bacterium]